MPALSLEGHNDLHQESDHDNSALDEEDEDEDEEVHTPPEGGSDEEGEDLTRSSVDETAPARTLRRMKLPTIDTTKLDISFSFPKGKTPMVLPMRRDAAEETPTAST